MPPFNLESKSDAENSTTYYSAGLHPWYVSESWPQELEALWSVLEQKKVVAVGECGFDRCCNTPLDVQVQAFEAQVKRAEQLNMPVILHCVRALDLLLGVHRRLRPDVPWVMHGFRGGVRQMQQLLHAGIHMSFGVRHIDSALQFCPRDSFFLETDDDDASLFELYHTVASLRDESVEELVASQLDNLIRLCGCK
ncbi:MAG: TatD family hydrolase [Clostridium sp.]|nr:TatD family hydrolase [Clostridium sp.]